jgi:hypothetical protein
LIRRHLGRFFITDLFRVGIGMGVTCNSHTLGDHLLRVVLLRLLVGCHGDRDVGLGFESRKHEILSQVLTGLASARDVLPEEVSGPHTFGIINLIY